VKFAQRWTKSKLLEPGVGQVWERVAMHEPRVIYLYETERYSDGSARWMYVKIDGVGKECGGISTEALKDLYARVT